MKGVPAPGSQEPLKLLSVVIPCRNEEGAIASTSEHLYVELRLHAVEHEIVTVDDGSTDSTWAVMQELQLANSHPASGTEHRRSRLRPGDRLRHRT